MTSANSQSEPDPADSDKARADDASTVDSQPTADAATEADPVGDRSAKPDTAPETASVLPESVLPESDLPEPIPGEPVPWHLSLRDYLRSADQSVWDWFDAPEQEREAGTSAAADHARRELLKTAYRLDRESDAHVYQLADQLRDRMGLSAPVTLYQAQNVSDLTAYLVWVPGELHVVLGGPLRDVLSEQEVAAVICHEFAHYELFHIEDGDLRRVDRMLSAMAADCAADTPHIRTLRTFRLWAELYCDRRAAQVLGNIDDCISALVKVETGLKDVSPAAYRHQAQELMAAGPLTSEGITHPETFLRAFALDCWMTDPESADSRMTPLVEGPLALKTLDLLQQVRLVTFSQRFVKWFLNETWLQSRLMLHHAQRFLDPEGTAGQAVSLTTEDITDDHWQQMKQEVDAFDTELRRYLCYVLLDFVSCDADLDEGPLAAAFLMCEQLGLSAEFRDLVRKELKPGKRVLQSVEANAEKIVRKMADEVPA